MKQLKDDNLAKTNITISAMHLLITEYIHSVNLTEQQIDQTNLSFQRILTHLQRLPIWTGYEQTIIDIFIS